MRTSKNSHKHQDHGKLASQIEALDELKAKVILSSSPLEKIVTDHSKKFPSPVLEKISYSRTKEILKKVCSSCSEFVLVIIFEFFI